MYSDFLCETIVGADFTHTFLLPHFSPLSASVRPDDGAVSRTSNLFFASRIYPTPSNKTLFSVLVTRSVLATQWPPWNWSRRIFRFSPPSVRPHSLLPSSVSHYAGGGGEGNRECVQPQWKREKGRRGGDPVGDL